ncbi:flavodoxin family protein [Lactobacillus panisapium]|uniref:Flavodoxin family protein n=2 Tax=Lactobacillus TaxID=1578 RepID=A0ABX8W894_9LACO|nr:NAD(P)H-dependent oxidoreductase [Lactobacillus panisapium]QYN53723.1 flavodoxin family protein [Lactobacillus panisapium]
MNKKFNLLKKLAIFLAIIGLVAGTAVITTRLNSDSSSVTAKSKAKKKFVKPRQTNQGARRVFINASQNKDGNTANLAKKLFGSSSYKQINLVDYRIPQIGQGDGDFPKVWNQLKGADVIVIGTPVYWSNMSGYLKTFIDHLNINNDLKGSDLYVIVQGADSNQTLAINSTYGTLNRVSKRFGLNFVGIAQTNSQANTLHNKMIGKK